MPGMTDRLDINPNKTRRVQAALDADLERGGTEDCQRAQHATAISLPNQLSDKDDGL